MTLALIFLPLAAAAAAMRIRADRPRRALLVATAAIHAARRRAAVSLALAGAADTGARLSAARGAPHRRSG